MIKYLKTFGFKVNNDAFEKDSWYFRNALVRANYNDLRNGVHATTKFLEMFFGNLILGTNHELKNRHMHIDYSDTADPDANRLETGRQVGTCVQSVGPEVPKSRFDTLEQTLEEQSVFDLISENPSVKQNELAAATGKSLSTVKRLTLSLQKKGYIRRVGGKRYGKWEILADEKERAGGR